MRRIFTLLFLFIGISFTQAQITISPLQSNPVLKNKSEKAEQLRSERLVRLFGDQGMNNNRVQDCDNEDGVYFSGDIIYLVAGDSVTLCQNLVPFIDTLKDVSFDLSFGTTVMPEDNCVTYYSNVGVSLGLTDTIRIDKCDTLGCLSFFYPVVVKRPDSVINLPNEELNPEEEVIICTQTTNLPGAISTTNVYDCGGDMAGEIFNVNFQDTCFVYVASRFAEPDSICFEICDEYCICDTYTYSFTTPGNSISYPFIDDFSYPGPFPDRSKWLDDNVYINSTMGFEPPSVGVATFDGISKTGTPYGGGYGKADFLTSGYFNLSPADTDLWLSFWAQNKGLSYPSFSGDSLIVEFKNDVGNWIQVFSVDGEDLNNADRPPFQFHTIEVDGGSSNNYLHSSFQFRFVSTGTLNGMYNTWHLDYVRMDQNEPDSTFKDLAFSSLPSDILSPYSSMPWWQFEGFAEEELDETSYYLYYNNFDEPRNNGGSLVNHFDFMTGADLNFMYTVSEAQLSIGAGEHQEGERNIPFLSDFASTLENTFSGAEQVFIERRYTLNNGSQSGIEEVLRNDTVRLTTVFDNYYAYDDGTAEAVASLDFTGHEIAIGFHTNIEDTLRAVQFNFPHFITIAGNALFNLKVYVGSLESDPVYVRNLIKPFFVDSVLDSLQGFTTYRLNDISGNLTPVHLPVGDFYVSWEQASSADNLVYVGLDFNSPEAQPHQFWNNNVDWYNLTDQGAFMVRPVVGSSAPGETPVKEVPLLSDWMEIFPNPANEQLHFNVLEGQTSDYEMQIFSTAGQLMQSQILNESINISELTPGMYLVTIRQMETNQVLTHKLAVMR